MADENKTKPTDADVGSFIASVENQTRREDAGTLLELFRRVTGFPAQMWGESIIGFGRDHYKYASGREGDFLITGFSPRKANMSIYIMPGFGQYEAQLKRLGPHKHSVSCLYLTRLARNDLSALEEIIADSVARMKDMNEWWER